MTLDWEAQLVPQVDVPEGETEHWRIERFTVGQTASGFHSVRDALRGGTGHIPVGTYTRLVEKKAFDDPIMYDTLTERREHFEPVREARERGGVVLITGLGLGFVANACLCIPSVDQVIVVEISGEIIQLVGPCLQEAWGSRLEIVEHDAFTFKPFRGAHQRYSVVWHDIWNYASVDNLSDSQRLCTRFRRYADWQSSWLVEYLRRVRENRNRLPR